MSVIDFPTEPPSAPGDFLFKTEYWECVIEGRVIPKLTGWEMDDGTIALCVDRRFTVAVQADRAKDVAWLLACALAVGAGYSNIHAESKERPFAPKLMRLDGES